MIYPTKRRVIVNTKSGNAFRGILWKRRFEYLTLRQAELLKSGHEAVTMDGEVFIFNKDVDFVQVLK